MKDHDPGIICAQMVLGDQVMRLDALETRMWAARDRGLYVAPELPADRAEAIATSVALEVIAASLEGRP
jgi:hypothetical protein